MYMNYYESVLIIKDVMNLQKTIKNHLILCCVWEEGLVVQIDGKKYYFSSLSCLKHIFQSQNQSELLFFLNSREKHICHKESHRQGRFMTSLKTLISQVILKVNDAIIIIQKKEIFQNLAIISFGYLLLITYG